MDSYYLNQPWRQFDQGLFPVAGRSADYPSGLCWLPHQHPTAQLIHAVRGVMVVTTEAGQWIVPPTRGVWVPPGMDHQMRTIGEVQLRTVYIRADASPCLPTQCQVVDISPLLRELILVAITVCAAVSCGLARRAFDDAAARRSCRAAEPPLAFCRSPATRHWRRSVAPSPPFPTIVRPCIDWADKLGVDAKTIQRRFAKQTGMDFRPVGDSRPGCARRSNCSHGGTKVVDVALALGYDSPSAFTAMFKRQFGSVPSAYFR